MEIKDTLSDDQYELIQENIDEVRKLPMPCVLCGAELRLHQELFVLKSYPQLVKPHILQSKVRMPLAAFVCDVCGYILLINAQIAGIFDGVEDE